MNDKLFTNNRGAQFEIADSFAVQVDRDDRHVEFKRDFEFPPNKAVQILRTLSDQHYYLFRRRETLPEPTLDRSFRCSVCEFRSRSCASWKLNSMCSRAIHPRI